MSKKNQTPEQEEKLRSGASFTLRHNEACTITLPTKTNITVSEKSEGYAASFRLGDAAAENVSQKTFSLTGDTTLAVTNTLDGEVQTGVRMHILLPLLAVPAAMTVVGLVLWRRRKRRDSND